MCFEPKTKYAILDENGKQFLNRAAELLKAGWKFVYVLDNIDWEEKVHDMRQEVQTRSVHALATSIVFDRVSSQGLPVSGPQQSLKDCNVLQVVDITPEELEAISKRYKILVGQLLFEHFPAFEMFKPFFPTSTGCHKYSKELSTKSEVFNNAYPHDR